MPQVLIPTVDPATLGDGTYLVIWQSGGQYKVLPSSANLRSIVTDETGTGQLVFNVSPSIVTPTLQLQQSANPLPITEGVIQWDTDQDRMVVGDGAGQAIFGQVTPWVAYTPTFTGFGTPSAVSIFSARLGDSLLLQGRFTGGTPTAVEARMTLGFNGTNANVTSDTAKIPSIRVAGTGVLSAASGVMTATLMESNVGYVTFGFQGAGNAGLTKLTGSAFLSSGVAYSFTAIVPIAGW